MVKVHLINVYLAYVFLTEVNEPIFNGLSRADHFFISSKVSPVGGKTNQIEPLRLGPNKFSFMKMWRAAALKFTTVNYYCEHDQTKKPGLAKNF